MGNNHGTQTLLNMNHEADEKGLTRARIPGELIYDKLVGQKDSNMISLPSVAAAVLAAAAAAARDLLPHRHRAAWRQRLSVQPAPRRRRRRRRCRSPLPLPPAVAAVAAAVAVAALYG